MSKSPNNQRMYSNCTIKRLEWHGLYAKSWNSAPLVPEAYAHPAKVSFGLAEQIYKFMLDEGMIKEGDVIGDPFGGIAGFAFHAMLNGLNFIGCELEPRFVDLGNQNIALWNGRYAPHMRRWGTAVLLQGDSRNFAAIVGGANGVVSSPPFLASLGHGKKETERKDYFNAVAGASGTDYLDYGSTPGQLGSMPPGDLDAVVSSPPFGEATTGAGIMINGHHTELRKGEAKKYGHRVYSADNQGDTAGNLAHLKASDADLDAIVSSPPYGDTIERGDGPGARWDADGHPGNPDKVSSDASYGRSPGQVGRLDGCVTSPPFESGIPQQDKNFTAPHDSTGNLQTAVYGSTSGNIGNDTGDTFWTASRAIVEQVHLALKPGGYVAFVTGDFVRRGKRVEFGRQWLALCEACGFEPVAWAVAWKTEHHGVQTGLFGDVEKRKDRVSFFRRLANEKNPDAAILNEDVIFMRKR